MSERSAQVGIQVTTVVVVDSAQCVRHDQSQNQSAASVPVGGRERSHSRVTGCSAVTHRSSERQWETVGGGQGRGGW